MTLFGYELDILLGAMFFSYAFGFISCALICVLGLFWYVNYIDEE